MKLLEETFDDIINLYTSHGLPWYSSTDES